MDSAELLRALKRMGFSHTRGRNNHHKFVSPGGDIVVVSGSTGDKRSVKNAISHLRRIGYDPESEVVGSYRFKK